MCLKAVEIKESIKSGHYKKEQTLSEKELTRTSKNKNTVIKMENSVHWLNNGLELKENKQTKR